MVSPILRASASTLERARGDTSTNFQVDGPDDLHSPSRVADEHTERRRRREAAVGIRATEAGRQPLRRALFRWRPGLQNANFRRDIVTALFMDYASSDDRVKLVLGTYDMKINVVSVEGDKATLTIIAKNRESAGSAFGLHIPGWSELLYSDDRSEGMCHPVEQRFYYEETISLDRPVPGSEISQGGGGGR